MKKLMRFEDFYYDPTQYNDMSDDTPLPYDTYDEDEEDIFIPTGIIDKTNPPNKTGLQDQVVKNNYKKAIYPRTM